MVQRGTVGIARMRPGEGANMHNAEQGGKAGGTDRWRATSVSREEGASGSCPKKLLRGGKHSQEKSGFLDKDVKKAPRVYGIIKDR